MIDRTYCIYLESLVDSSCCKSSKCWRLSVKMKIDNKHLKTSFLWPLRSIMHRNFIREIQLYPAPCVWHKNGSGLWAEVLELILRVLCCQPVRLTSLKWPSSAARPALPSGEDTLQVTPLLHALVTYVHCILGKCAIVWKAIFQVSHNQNLQVPKI